MTEIIPKTKSDQMSNYPGYKIGAFPDSASLPFNSKPIYKLSDASSAEPYDLKSALAICFIVGALVSFLAVIIMAVISYLDMKLDKKRGLASDNKNRNQNSKKIKSLSLKDIKNISISAWALIYIFTIWYSAMFPFNSMLPGYIKMHCGS